MLKRKRLVVLGAGESGIGTALLAKQKGYDVFVSDGGIIKQIYKQELIDNNILFEEEKHTESQILNADEIMKSPGIPEKNEMIKKIRTQQIPIISEIEFAYRYKGDSKVIAITGSNGKSTTTALTHHICKNAGWDCAMVGNIGYSFARQVALDPKPLYVVEVSSFQLDDIHAFRPDVAVLLNITEDHLDRYEYKFENYIKSKFRIIENQTKDDYFIYREDDSIIMDHFKSMTVTTNKLPFSMKNKVKIGAYIQNETMSIKMKDEEVTSMSVHDFAVKGKHNQQNAMAAGLAGSVMGIRNEAIRNAMTTAETLEHRMEYVTNVNGIRFINDSKSTNVNSTWYALEEMKQPTVLILGGVDKGNDYSILNELVHEKVRAIVCMGLDNTKIHEALGNKVPVMKDVQSAYEAVQTAFELAKEGDIVLLSPACASFDLFKNFEDRGTQFKEAAKELK